MEQNNVHIRLAANVYIRVLRLAIIPGLESFLMRAGYRAKAASNSCSVIVSQEIISTRREQEESTAC